MVGRGVRVVAQACLRGVANHMAMLCWLGNFAGLAVVQLPSWKALHDCWHQQARDEMRSGAGDGSFMVDRWGTGDDP